MRKKSLFGILVLVVLFFFTMAVSINAFSFKDLFISKDVQTGGKNMSKAAEKDGNKIIEKDKTLQKETAKGAIKTITKEVPPGKTAALYDDESNPLTKTTDNAKNMKIQSKLQVVNDKEIKVLGLNTNTVCFNPIDKVLTLTETESPPAAANGYEFRTVMGECSAAGQKTHEDDGIKIDCNFGRQMFAHCSDGYIINYGGGCSVGNKVEILGPNVANAYRSAGYTTHWGDFPAINEVFLSCGGGIDSSKHIILTCMREKS